MIASKPRALHLASDEVAARYGFVPGLNGLRAISIGLVLIGHFLLPQKYEGLSALGVFLFFGISGFLITRLLFAEQKRFGAINLSGFFYRRYLRLYPVLFVYLAFACFIMVHARRPIPGIEVASVLFYFTNYLENHYRLLGTTLQMPIGALWSLAVEEHFYLIMPFAFLVLRGRPRPMVWMALALTILPLAIRFAYMSIWPHLIGTEFVYRPSETRFDSIAIGVLIAALCELPGGQRIMSRLSGHRALAVGIGLLVAAFAFKQGIFGDTIRYTMRNIGCALLLIPLVFGANLAWLQRLINLPLVDGVGRISYSLYIWQGGAVPIMGLLGVNHDMFGHGILAISCTFVLAILSYRLVEKPALRFKNRGPRAQPSQPASDSAN